ncbi:excinuclease ABC subunit UvrA [Bdellovibrionota bacterium FG-2]
MAQQPIRLVKVKQNNLKGISVEFPARRLTVITGVSGSGKSSLAFDTLYAEGQRRYVESLSTYTRQFLEKMPKPDLESIENIPPAIALEQRNHVVSARSTVGSHTEIVDYLRVLFAKVGKTYCLDCLDSKEEVKHLTPDAILEWALNWLPVRKALLVAPLTPVQKQEDQKPQDARKPKGKKSKTPPPSALDSILQIVREQGFTRILYRSGKIQPIMWELDDSTSAPPRATLERALKNHELFVVIDRLRLIAEPDSDARARLHDSIAQALHLGKGTLAFMDLDSYEWKTLESRFACLRCGREYKVPEPQSFSSHSPLGACDNCSGFGFTLDLDEKLVVPDPTKTIKNGAIDPFSKPSFSDWQKDLFRFAERQGISTGKRYSELTPEQRRILWEGDPKDQTFPGIIACFEELKRWKYKLYVRVFIRRYQKQELCTHCNGSRIKADALAVRLGELNFFDVCKRPIEKSLVWLNGLSLNKNETKIAAEPLAQVKRRLSFLDEVGVGYLTLNRQTKTLSGGEFQRINLATQLGNGLCGTLYVLDEPSIGLHASDTRRLIRILERLRDQGNTVVIVEHDLEVMRAADWLIELGPGAGHRGGELITQGNAGDLARTPHSLTGKYLSGVFHLQQKPRTRAPIRRFLKITGCKENNLQNLTIEIPLDRFVVVTGVSGSGKSTLVHKTLFAALDRHYNHAVDRAGEFERLYGAEQLGGVVLLDQSPIGKSSRSNPATYLKAWDEIRRLFAGQTASLRRGYMPQHFSFNVDGGRCPVCKGEGEITLDMHFMAEVKLPCEECEGKRFKKTVLDIRVRGKNVHEILHSTIDEVFELFRDNPVLARKLGVLRSVGLGYLQLGQSSSTLSGGESQRLKIASALDDKEGENLLYIFDEPTTGLHHEDIKKLLAVVQDLVDAKNSVLMIEHHLDVIAAADWVIDLGPGGGEHGGQIMSQGTPEDIKNDPNSLTGQMLSSAHPLDLSHEHVTLQD